MPKNTWGPAIIVTITMWLMLAGVLMKTSFPRLTMAIQAAVIFVGFVLLIYGLIYGFKHRG